MAADRRHVPAPRVELARAPLIYPRCSLTSLACLASMCAGAARVARAAVAHIDGGLPLTIDKVLLGVAAGGPAEAGLRLCRPPSPPRGLNRGGDWWAWNR